MSQHSFAFMGSFTKVTIVRNQVNEKRYGYHYLFGDDLTFCGLRSGKHRKLRRVEKTIEQADEMVKCGTCRKRKRAYEAMGSTEQGWRPTEMLPEDFYS